MVHIQIHPGYLQITNPGGFLEGITLDNLLVHEPKPRNPRLAEAFRRINLVETTGRGIDKIYMGQLRYGRSLPDYSRSDREAIRLTLLSDANLAFAAFVYDEDAAGRALDMDELLILNYLRRERRISLDSAGRLTQRGPLYAQAALDRLSGQSFIEERQERQEQFYYLNTQLHHRIGQLPRMLQPNMAEREEMVVRYIEQYGHITRRQVVDLLNVTDRQARRLLTRLIASNKIHLQGSSVTSRYVRT
ncbi:MAG: hypothetical protein M3014_05155 [Chloroflexota bacterium]|nr:hypothetical protein [Chloroflexota bacterium]